MLSPREASLSSRALFHRSHSSARPTGGLDPRLLAEREHVAGVEPGGAGLVVHLHGPFVGGSVGQRIGSVEVVGGPLESPRGNLRRVELQDLLAVRFEVDISAALGEVELRRIVVDRQNAQGGIVVEPHEGRAVDHELGPTVVGHPQFVPLVQRRVDRDGGPLARLGVADLDVAAHKPDADLPQSGGQGGGGKQDGAEQEKERLSEAHADLVCGRRGE